MCFPVLQVSFWPFWLWNTICVFIMLVTYGAPERLNKNRFYQKGFFLCSYRFLMFRLYSHNFVVVWCETCICMCHWRSIFRLFLEGFQVFVDKLFIGHPAPLQCDLLDLLYCCFLFLFLLNSLVCSIDRLYGMQLICVLVVHVCVSGHLVMFSAVIVSFLKELNFILWLVSWLLS